MVDLRDIAWAVKRLQHRHNRTLDADLAPLGTTLVQWDALRVIGRHPGSSSHRIAQLTFQTDQAFGTLAARLVARGLIDRTPGPGRSIRHRLTPAGEAVLRDGHAVVDEAFAASFAPLDGDERSALHELLIRVLHDGTPGPHDDRTATGDPVPS